MTKFAAKIRRVVAHTSFVDSMPELIAGVSISQVYSSLIHAECSNTRIWARFTSYSKTVVLCIVCSLRRASPISSLWFS